jgi:hypothetical protein
MADVRKKKAPVKATKKKPRTLYTLTKEELDEYNRRHAFMVLKNTELQAASNFMEIFQNALIEEHGLPISFDLDLETGRITERQVEGVDETNAQNGRV